MLLEDTKDQFIINFVGCENGLVGLYENIILYLNIIFREVSEGFYRQAGLGSDRSGR